MSMKNVFDAVEYFERAPFHKLFQAFRIRCESIGEAAGTIYTAPLSYEELAALADFMDVSAYALDLQRKLSLKDFEEKLETKYPGVKLEQLLRVYFAMKDVPLISKK